VWHGMVGHHTRAGHLAIDFGDRYDPARKQITYELDQLRVPGERLAPPLLRSPLFDQPSNIGVEKRQYGVGVLARSCPELRHRNAPLRSHGTARCKPDRPRCVARPGMPFSGTSYLLVVPSRMRIAPQFTSR